MAKYINKSRLKLYHEPLTQKIIDRMHGAKTQKAQAELLKKRQKRKLMSELELQRPRDLRKKC